MRLRASYQMGFRMVGVYSVLSCAVSRRTREIGIRLALGAEATDVRRMVMMSGLRWLLVGIGIGVPASIVLAKILQNRIWGIKIYRPPDVDCSFSYPDGGWPGGVLLSRAPSHQGRSDSGAEIRIGLRCQVRGPRCQ